MKENNRILLVVVLFYIIFQVLLNVMLFQKVDEYASTQGLTAEASGNVKFCNNMPPSIHYNCAQEVNQSERFFCRINVTDDPSEAISFEGDVTPADLFTVTPNGIIDFTPNATQVGNFSFRVYVWGNSGCPNSFTAGMYNLNVRNINDPPVLVQPIPNLTWNQGTSLVAFDIDNYFWDPDGDPINYTYVLLPDIDVSLDPTNIVTFTPVITFYGIETIEFFAWDPYMANASSNNITLNVVQTIFPPQPQESSGATGGGGGGGQIPSCLPRWYCRPWGPCEPDSKRNRECYDLNNCTSDLGKPNTTEPCDFVSTCYDGFKGPGEEGIDCGGACPPCGNCYDTICNNNEDCTKGLTSLPDCGGTCKACEYGSNETCYDNICNNGEDCTKGLSELPDCGGSCDKCPAIETPIIVQAINWALIVLLTLMVLVAVYMVRRTYPYLVLFARKKRKKYYEERLLLEAKVSESIFDSLLKLEKLLSSEMIEKLILLLATIVRRYFKSLFSLKYEFTYEELMHEIQSKAVSPTFKSVLKSFFERSTEIEFSGKVVSREELVAMVSEFKQIVSLTSEKPFLEEEKEKKEKQEKASNKVDLLFVKISEAESSLRRMDLNDAYFKYLRLVHDFKYLSVKEKQKLHGFVSRLYDEIKLAREKYEYEYGEK